MWRIFYSIGINGDFLKPLGNESRHSLSRKDEKRQRKAVKAKGRQAARKELNEEYLEELKVKMVKYYGL